MPGQATIPVVNGQIDLADSAVRNALTLLPSTELAEFQRYGAVFS
jgi:hypothetical protein